MCCCLLYDRDECTFEESMECCLLRARLFEYGGITIGKYVLN